MLTPPADPATDTEVEERRTAASIAVAGSELERIGNLSVLPDLEEALDRTSVPVASLRRPTATAA